MKAFALIALRTKMLLKQRRFQIMLVLLVTMTWLSVEVYHDLVIRGLPVAYVDDDHSQISCTLYRFLDASREIDLVETSALSPEEVQELLMRGEVSAVVRIPSGLSSDLKKGKTVSVPVTIDMSNILIGKNVRKAVAQCIGTIAAGAELTVIRKMGEGSQRAMARVLPITIEEQFSFNPAANYSVYIVPGLAFFFLHVFVLILATSVFLKTSDAKTPPDIAASLVAVFLVGMVLGLAFFYLLLPYESINSASAPHIILICLGIFLFLDILMAAAIQACIPSDFLGMEITIVLGMLSLMFCGITWPMDAFPAPIRIIAQWIPFTPFAQGFRMFLHFPTGLMEMGSIFRLFALQGIAFVLLIFTGTTTRLLLARRTRPKHVEAQP